MGIEDLSRRDIAPGLIIYPKPEEFLKDTDQYKILPIPPTVIPYVCLWVNDEESEWVRLSKRDGSNHLPIQRTSIRNAPSGFNDGSYITQDKFTINNSNVIKACRSTTTPRPMLYPVVTSKVREHFGYEEKTPGVPLSMATPKDPILQLPTKTLSTEKSMKKSKARTKTWNAPKEAYKKMVELHTQKNMGSKEIAHVLDLPVSIVKAKLKRDKVYNQDLDLFKNPTSGSQNLSASKEASIEEKMAQLQSAMDALNKQIGIRKQAENDLNDLVEKYKKEGFTITFEIE